MRLPAVAIAAAFACGILLGLHPAVARNAASFLILSCSFAVAAALILTGMYFVKIERLIFAALASLLSWAWLGFLGVCIAEQPRNPNHVLSLMGQGRLPVKTPLRWHGHLHDEPTRLPWGYGYEIEISGVEFEGALRAARGGLRLSYTAHPEGGPPPDVHAGDQVAVLAEANLPQVFRDEGAFDGRAYLAQQNIDLVATLRAAKLIERIGPPTSTVTTALARARRRLRDEIDELFVATPQAAGVLRAMLLGDRSFVERSEATDFQKTGVFHVLVVAGLHVGAIAFALYWVGRKLRLSRVWTMLFTLSLLENREPSTATFRPAAQPSAPVTPTRETSATVLPPQRRPPACPSKAAVLKRAIAPASADRYGIESRAARERHRVLHRAILEAPAHRVPLSAPLVNLVAVPLVGVVVPLGFLTLACGLIFPAAGKLLAAPLAWLTTLLLHVVQWFAHFRGWSYRIPGPPVWLILLFFAAGLLIAAELRLQLPLRRSVAWGMFLVFAASALTIAIYPFGEKWARGRLELTVVDVGQGDSLFVVSPGGKTLLIDGGGAFGGFPGHEEHNGIDPGEEAVSPYLWSRGFQKLDVVALTHAHQDHLGGLSAILENFRIGRLWIGREESSPALLRLEDLARERNVPIEHELRGRSFHWDGVDGDFLWPEMAPEEAATSAKNNDSLVLRLRYGNRTMLLPGDAERQVEREMLSEDEAETLHSDVLKVGHHGSKNSTIPEFLAAVQPRFAIISAGEFNPYGHPHAELLERLEKTGAVILRTDRDGAVRVVTDGERLEITYFVACPGAAKAGTSMQAQAPDRQQNQKKE
jgi:beta-lactamase superfamily II metal-dependent hydrolase